MENLSSLIKLLIKIGSNVYAYCTDFIINMANLTGTSYYEINFLFFCVLVPLLLIALPLTAVLLKIRLRRLQAQQPT